MLFLIKSLLLLLHSSLLTHVFISFPLFLIFLLLFSLLHLFSELFLVLQSSLLFLRVYFATPCNPFRDNWLLLCDSRLTIRIIPSLILLFLLPWLLLLRHRLLLDGLLLNAVISWALFPPIHNLHHVHVVFLIILILRYLLRLFSFLFQPHLLFKFSSVLGFFVSLCWLSLSRLLVLLLALGRRLVLLLLVAELDWGLLKLHHRLLSHWRQVTKLYHLVLLKLCRLLLLLRQKVALRRWWIVEVTLGRIRFPDNREVHLIFIRVLSILTHLLLKLSRIFTFFLHFQSLFAIFLATKYVTATLCILLLQLFLLQLSLVWNLRSRLNARRETPARR